MMLEGEAKGYLGKVGRSLARTGISGGKGGGEGSFPSLA